MSAYTYILECADGSLYTGSTKNIEARIFQHQTGIGAKYTKTRLPVTLVFLEEYDRIDEAFEREKQIQKWSRKKKLAIIEGNFRKLKKYARNYTQFGKPD